MTKKTGQHGTRRAMQKALKRAGVKASRFVVVTHHQNRHNRRGFVRSGNQLTLYCGERVIIGVVV